ncbi:MAG: thiol-disulfide oxidoreductase DCC family protein [Methylobacteriaceae bacterium]|nr:thiol-disulfide oxidoreductase DCC family protein [Methylobacteriaceae bacterium]MBV9243620.1 thiol-disulfide oxidoreductase DCC family protein [Methylobacteriaceae bacterium]
MNDRKTDAPTAPLPEGLILFDGVCVLCSAWVAFILPRDKPGRFRFAAMQSALGRSLSARLGIDPDHPETFVLIRHGAARVKSDGALAILAELPGWRWTRSLRLIPRTVRDWLYDRVARNRYRLFGRRSTCFVPDPSTAERFLDLASRAPQ